MSLKAKRTPGFKSASATAGLPTVKDGLAVEQFKCKFTLKGIDEDSDPENYIVEGYASIFDGLDSYDDRIQKGAYTDTIKNHPEGFAAFVMHDTWREMPVGLWNELAEDDKGLFVKCNLPKADKEVSGRLVPQIRVGSVNALSIGYWAKEFRYIMEDELQIRILETIELREISFIAINYQADPGALLTGLKKADGQTDEQATFNGMVDVYRKGATPRLKSEVVEFYHKKGLANPFGEDSVVSTEELKNLSKSNLAFAIRELKLSSNASTYLAGLVLAPASADDPEGKNKPADADVSEDDVKDSLDGLLTTLKK